MTLTLPMPYIPSEALTGKLKTPKHKEIQQQKKHSKSNKHLQSSMKKEKQKTKIITYKAII